ncbi:MAG: phosphoribosyl-AMP cyclohydrolase [Clostridiales bacterium]|nr:phosphoribosyl-AMP cyclohydrolase [Clostridiales bacterium]
MSWSDLKTDAAGLVPVIVQDWENGQVLMLAYMNQQAFEDTVRSGKMHYYSRSRQSQWLKGETSGHFQYVKSLYLDCDNDTLLARVEQVGVACHTGSRSCFYRGIKTFL